MKPTNPQKSILSLPYPVVGLAPMDGVTDSPFRQITKKYGNPDIIFTEFTNVMGMIINPERVIHHFEFEEMERPIVAQIYGKEPEYFYHVAKIIAALGYDGVDINMGCPAKNVTARGSGAALIQTPELAKEIIFQVKRGVADWVKDGKLTGMKKKQQKFVEEFVEGYRERAGKIHGRDKACLVPTGSTGHQNLTTTNRQEIPVSVKTRIGYDEPVTEWWIQWLTEADPEWISIHGRTLKQMYSGGADWDELKLAVDSTDIPVMTNGDIKEQKDIDRMLEHTGAAGVLIGRASFGNPWIFRSKVKDKKSKIVPMERPQEKLLSDSSIEMEKKLAVMLEHAEIFSKMYPEERAFVQMRKHFGWYCKGFDGAKELRKKLVRAKSLEEVREVVGVSSL